MSDRLIARAFISVNAPDHRVWEALVDPAAIKLYMFGTQVTADWREGGAIAWKGEWQGNTYEDHGRILQFQPGRLIEYSHYSPLSGAPDVPENYHTVKIELSSDGVNTHLSLRQDNNASEAERLHSEQNWQMMLEKLKEYLEGNNPVKHSTF